MIVISKIYHINLGKVNPVKEKSSSKNFDDILDAYTVQKGDSLYKIARNYLKREGFNPSSKYIEKFVHKIAVENNIKNPNRIFVGQKIYFPDTKLADNNFFIKPVKGYLSSKFGIRVDPFTKELRFHSGVDIAAPKGTPIHAAASGEVIFSGKERGYGNIVIIKHRNNLITKYAHASKLLVKKGDYVKQGETIGLVGSTGRSTGPHLHFEIRVNNKAVNPLKFITI
jgi:murein DD-endopeptidase MepM/ murein hydrolase activator NlpD